MTSPHQKHDSNPRSYFWTMIIVVIFLILSLIIIGCMVYLLKKITVFKDSSDCANYDITQEAFSCTKNPSQEGYCVCNKKTPSKKICYQYDANDPNPVVTLSFPSISTKVVLPPLNDLPTDDAYPYTAEVAHGYNLAAYRDPCDVQQNDVNSHVLCIYNPEGLEGARRLCFNVQNQNVFIMGPVDNPQLPLSS